MTILTFILRRAASQWTRLLTLSLGVLLAAALLAASPTLITTILDFSLRRTLANAPALASNVRITSRLDLAEQSFSALDTERRAEIETHLGPYAETVITGGAMIPFNPWRDGELITDERVFLRSYDSAENLRRQIEFVDGTWPDQWVVSAENTPVLISAPFATAYDLSVGSQLPLSSSRAVEKPSFSATVIGIIQPIDPQSDYWFGSLSPLRPFTDGRFLAEYSMLLPPEALLDAAQVHFPDNDLALHWNIILANSTLSQADIEPLSDAVWLWRDDALNETNLTVFSGIDETLDQFKSQASIVQAPLYFVLLIVALLALFYIVLVSALSLAQTQDEFAVLISRGANSDQIMLWQGVETIIIVLLGALIGPLLAWGGVQILSRVGSLGLVRSADWAISFTQTAWLAALIGAVAAAATAFLPLPTTLRSSVVTHLQRRVRQQETRPWWQRYYVDVMLLAVGGILIARLPIYGSILGGTERDTVDWLLLLAPALLLFGTATVFLRGLPPLLHLVATLASRRRGLPLVLALWQAARQPRHVSRLLLLLTITTALGLFATSLNATLAKNESARARFLSLGAQRLRLLTVDRATILTDDSTTLWRSVGAFGSRIGAGEDRFEVLGIDPETFNQVASYRADFADRPVDTMVASLEPQLPDPFRTPPFIELPTQPRQIELYFWMREADAEFVPGFLFDAKLFMATDEYLTVRLRPSGERGENGWTRFSAEIPPLDPEQYPVSLTSLWMRTSNQITIFPDEPPAIDQISVTDVAGVTTVINGFEAGDIQDWFSTYGLMFPRIEAQRPYAGEFALGLPINFQFLAIGFPYGLHVWSPEQQEPLPILATPNFMAASGAAVGDTVGARISTGSVTWVPISLKIIDVVNYFPTMEEGESGGSMITLRDPLIRYANTFDHRLAAPNEIAFIDPTDDASLRNSAVEVWAFDDLRASLQATPLVLGLRTVTTFGYVLTAILSLAGFATYFFLNTRQQSGSYAVLRALGMSVRQLYVTLLIEQAILILFGLSIGSLLGLILSRMTLRNLAFRTGELVALPPFELVIGWMAVASVLLTLTMAFVFILGLVTLSLWRTDIHRALRVGEE